MAQGSGGRGTWREADSEKTPKGRKCSGARSRGREADRWTNGSGLEMRYQFIMAKGPAWVLEEPGPLVRVSPAEATAYPYKGPQLWSKRMQCVHPLLLHALPNSWSLPQPTPSPPDFSCLFLSTLLCLHLSSLVHFPEANAQISMRKQSGLCLGGVGDSTIQVSFSSPD